jgi:DNA-binding transcriptional LysR family regulator
LKRHPNFRIKLLDQRFPVEIRTKQLLEGQYDLTISNHRILEHEIENIPFCKEQFSLIVSKHSEAERRLFPDGVIPKKIEVRKFKDEKLILLNRRYHGRIINDQMFEEEGIVPQVVMEVSSGEVAKELAISGIGCTLYPETLIHGQPVYNEQDNYHVIMVDHPHAKQDLYISYNKSNYLDRFCKSFIDIAIEQFK